MAGVGKAGVEILSELMNNPKNLLYVPAAAVGYQLTDLIAPTTEELGEYFKNSLIPGIVNKNIKKETERDAYKEMKGKQLPKTMGDIVRKDVAKQQHCRIPSDVLNKLPNITQDLMKDRYIADAGKERIDKITSNLLNIAPFSLSSNPALLQSVVRAAVLSGSDSLDPSTVISLSQIEKNMTEL